MHGLWEKNLVSINSINIYCNNRISVSIVFNISTSINIRIGIRISISIGTSIGTSISNN